MKGSFVGGDIMSKRKILIFNVFLLFIGVSLGIFGIQKEDNSVLEYSYNVNKMADYTVALMPNNLYDESVLVSGRSYPNTLVDTIHFDFSYLLKGLNKKKIVYSDEVAATLVGNYEENNGISKDEVWRKEYTLKGRSSDSVIDTKNLKLSDSIDIDYRYFDTLVKDYIKSTNLKLNCFLEISYNVYYSVDVSGMNGVKKQDTIKVRVPLNEPVVKVYHDYEKNSHSAYRKKGEESISIVKILELAIGVILIVVALVNIVRQLTSKKKKKGAKQRYLDNLAKFRKEYGDLMVSVANKPNISGLSVLHIDLLTDLIDLCEQRNTTMIAYETFKNKETTLYVILENYCYQYKITSAELK